jgi:DNA-binding CsgD family transcriptional regulator
VADVHRRALARCAALGRAAGDARTLRIEVLEQLRSPLGFDGYAWLLTDPVTEVGTAPVADVPWLAELPRQIRLKYLTGLNRWTSLHERAVGLLAQDTGGELGRSLVWQDLLSEHGVCDAASVVFRDRFGCWGFLELWRQRGTFSAADGELLSELAALLTPELRRLQAATFDGAPQRFDPGPGVLLLSPELLVRSQTPETQQYLRLLVPPAGGQAPVPAGAYNVAAQLLAVEAGVDDHPPSARVHLAGSRWVTLRAARLGDTADSDIAVTIERTSAGERADLFARACGLSHREYELLQCLVEGADTREVAQRMFLSQNTVQDHLKSVFAKTSVRNRRTLLARALGT